MQSPVSPVSLGFQFLFPLLFLFRSPFVFCFHGLIEEEVSDPIVFSLRGTESRVTGDDCPVFAPESDHVVRPGGVHGDPSAGLTLMDARD